MLPIAYLVDEAGVIAHNAVVGTDAILDLMARAERVLEEAQALATR